jgi:hypothetical protein
MKKLVFLFVGVLVLSACEPDPKPPVGGNTNSDEQVSMSLAISHTFGNMPLTLNQPYFNTGRNDIRFTNIQYFVSDLKLQKMDGSWLTVPFYAMFTAQSQESAQVNIANIPKGNYKGVGFSIGVDSIANHSDPAIWPNGHPLSIMEGGAMHWSWNSGYIFIKVEGNYKIDGNPDGGFAYHIGRDDLRVDIRQENIQLDLNASGNTVQFSLDLQTFFDSPNSFTITPATSFTHAAVGDTVATQLTQNLQAAINFEGVNP